MISTSKPYIDNKDLVVVLVSYTLLGKSQLSLRHASSPQGKPKY